MHDTAPPISVLKWGEEICRLSPPAPMVWALASGDTPSLPTVDLDGQIAALMRTIVRGPFLHCPSYD